MAEQLAIRGHAANAIFFRNRTRRTQRLFGTPEMEMFHRTLSKVLTFWYLQGFRIAFDLRDFDPALAKLDCEPHANRAPTHDDDVSLLHLGFCHAVLDRACF